MTLCPKCQISIARKEDSVQCATCNTVTHMKCSKMDKDSLEYLKSIGQKYNCDECVSQSKNGRHDDTPIKANTKTKEKMLPSTLEIDTKSIINRLDEVLRNQVTTNNTLETLSNRIIELEKSLKEKDKVIQSLEYKINTLEQNEKSCYVEISGVQKEKEENVENLVHDIAGVLGIDLNLFDIENAYRKPSIRNIDKPLIIIELASRRKRDEFIKKRGKIEYKSQRIYINESLTAFNKKLFWESRMKGKELGYRFIWTSHGRIYCKKDEQGKKIQVKCLEDLNFL